MEIVRSVQTYLVIGFMEVMNHWSYNVKLGMETDHNHIYKVGMRHILKINNYKRGDGPKL